ncbi:MAG: serine/threonine-protein kinase HipA [Gammaproteobacteria bacterium]|jgi:serine/threonine-protein kinase HipA
MSQATVKLWGTTVGYIAMDSDESFARFEYDPAFASMGIELAPLQMPVKPTRVHQFKTLEPRTFHGLPGLLADSLPDKYGNQLINVWLSQTGREARDFNAVDRLCYVGNRAMGALEYIPSSKSKNSKDKRLEVEQLVELASLAFASRDSLKARLSDDMDGADLLEAISVGTSAGGARAKAVIAYNPQTEEIRSGQSQLQAGYEHWLIKFDGVKFSGDWGVADPSGYGLLEYSYYLMARRCGIKMMESKLLQENSRSHFMTRRFDRDDRGKKYFMQTFGAIAHADYYESGAYSYEQVLMVMTQLGMGKSELEEQVRRIVFNIVGCNQDDHVKNTSFMMSRKGEWSLSPAYDLCHAEGSDFTRSHQLSLNGKTNDFNRDDLRHLAEYAGLPRGREKIILEKTLDAFSGWSTEANALAIPDRLRQHVVSTLRLNW